MADVCRLTLPRGSGPRFSLDIAAHDFRLALTMVDSRFLSDYLETEYTVAREHEGMRADAYLALHVEFFSRTRLKQKIQEGQTLLNGHSHNASRRVRVGDVFKVVWRKVDDRLPPPDPVILYEDDYILAADKPAGMAVHPTGRKQSGTLIQGVHAYCREQILASLEDERTDFYPRLINRLDLFTSGIVLVAKRKDVFVRFQEQQVMNGFAKRYLVITEGRLAQDEGEIDAPIGRDEASVIFIKMTVREDGLPSRTRYRVRERLREHTVLEAWPITGRQHQLRVHFCHIGHPVWGDLIYKDEALFLRYYDQEFRLEGLPPRHALHAEYLAFQHACTGELVEITSPVPGDFTNIIQSVS